VQILDYVICHDAGVIVNPLLADGQTIGSAVQGLGNVTSEEICYDSDGRPLIRILHQYILPGSTDTPDYQIFEQHFPARTNPEGFRGLAEGGAIPSLPALAQAIEDALSPFGVRLNSLPLTPQHLHEALLRAAGSTSPEGGAA
jgi:carbon-monoxide dehydrogenase large subunit